MNKRGISPLIATVLIIGLVIVIASVVLLWGTKFTKEVVEGTTATQKKLQVLSEAGIKIVSYDLKSGSVIEMVIENIGTVPISRFQVIFEGNGGDSVISRAYPANLEEFATTSYDFSYGDPTTGESAVGTLVKVKVVPLIDVNEEGDVVTGAGFEPTGPDGQYVPSGGGGGSYSGGSSEEYPHIVSCGSNLECTEEGKYCTIPDSTDNSGVCVTPSCSADGLNTGCVINELCIYDEEYPGRSYCECQSIGEEIIGDNIDNNCNGEVDECLRDTCGDGGIYVNGIEVSRSCQVDDDCSLQWMSCCYPYGGIDYSMEPWVAVNTESWNNAGVCDGTVNCYLMTYILGYNNLNYEARCENNICQKYYCGLDPVTGEGICGEEGVGRPPLRLEIVDGTKIVPEAGDLVNEPQQRRTL